MIEPISAFAPSTVPCRPSSFSGNADLPSATERAVMLVRQIASGCKDCLRRNRDCRRCALEPARGIVQALELEGVKTSQEILEEKREKGLAPKKSAIPREGTRLRLAYDWLLANPGWHSASGISAALPTPKGRTTSRDSDAMLATELFRRGAVERRAMSAEERAACLGLRGSIAFMYRLKTPQDD